MGVGHRHPAIRIAKLALAPDYLSKLPKRGHHYLSASGKPLWDNRYSPIQESKGAKKRLSKAAEVAKAKREAQRQSCAACLLHETVTASLLYADTSKPLRGLDTCRRNRSTMPPCEDRFLNRQSDYQPPFQEDAFHSKPMINLPVPDHVQAMLVDDWENITKNNQLVPLPHPKPVSKIFQDYLAYEAPRREEGSASMDILEEVIAGFREYFEKALSRILLYR